MDDKIGETDYVKRNHSLFSFQLLKRGFVKPRFRNREFSLKRAKPNQHRNRGFPKPRFRCWFRIALKFPALALAVAMALGLALAQATQGHGPRATSEKPYSGPGWKN